MKAIPYVIFGLLATVYTVRTIRKSLNEPPEEERVYTSPEAAIIEGADDDDDWFLEPDA